MKYLKQFAIILAFTFIGETIHFLFPLPIPASIYGLVFLFFCLYTGYLKTSEIRESASFLLDIMPVLFIPAAAGLLQIWDILAPIWLPFITITMIATCIVLAVSGKVVQTARKITHNKAALQTDT